jgi:putative CocE/NonD family hydrolase
VPERCDQGSDQGLDEWMPCSDGVRLATRLWCPPAGEGPWPALLMRQPYGRRIASTVVYAHPRWYAARGFLVVVQDVRGRGDSEGVFGGFAQEAEDGRCALRWLRAHPACNGRIGTYGFSYQGLSQLLIGVDGDGGHGGADPALLPDALAPAMCGLDERRHWAAEGGAHWWALLLGWGLQLAAEGCRRRGERQAWQEIRRCLEGGEAPRRGLDLLQRHDPEGMVTQWLGRDPAVPEGWRIHEPSGALLRRPLLLIGGWHDPHLRGVLDLWRRSRAAGGDPELLIGAWSHLDWGGGVDERQLAFFRRHLQPGADPPARAGSNAAPPPLSLQCVLRGTWCQPPPPRLHAEPDPAWVCTLRSGGLAAVRRDEGELLPAADGGGGGGGGEVVLVHDPWRPVPGRGGHLGLEPGLVSREDLDGRADVACFTSPPLAEERELLGEPRLRIEVAAEEGFDLCASLSVLGDAGAMRQLCVGVFRQRAARPPGAGPLELRLQPLRATLVAGERLRLSLAGAAWPQIAVHPGRSDRLPGPSGPDHRVISLVLRLEGSCLWLAPLIGAD